MRETGGRGAESPRWHKHDGNPRDGEPATEGLSPGEAGGGGAWAPRPRVPAVAGAAWWRSSSRLPPAAPPQNASLEHWRP